MRKQLRQALSIIRRQFQVMQDQREMLLRQDRIITTYQIANQTLLDLFNKPPEVVPAMDRQSLSKWIN